MLGREGELLWNIFRYLGGLVCGLGVLLLACWLVIRLLIRLGIYEPADPFNHRLERLLAICVLGVLLLATGGVAILFMLTMALSLGPSPF